MNDLSGLRFLVEKAELPEDAARAFASGIQRTDGSSVGDPYRAAIKIATDTGHCRTYVSQNWSNFLLNWRKSLSEVVRSMAVVAFASYSHPIGGVLAALSAYKSIVGAFEIPLTERHAKIVDQLWLKHENYPVVPLESLLKAGAEEGIPETEIRKILEDLDGLGLAEMKTADGRETVLKTDYIVA